MNKELTNKMINNEEFNISDFQSKFSKYKKRDKKYKIIFAIIISFILCLLCIIIFKLFYSSKIQIEKKEEKKEGQMKLSDEIEFIKYYQNFPFCLKINENGIIDFDNNSLDNAPLDKLMFEKDYDYEFSKVEIDKESKITNSENFDLALSCNFKFLFYCDAKYKNKIDEVKKGSTKNSLLMVKKRLSTLSVKRKNIQLNDNFKKKIEDIANEESYSDEKKALKLDKLFTEYGYFIPLKITVGGYFYKEVNQIENEKLLNNLNNLESNFKFNKSINLNSSVEYNKLQEEILKNLFSEEKIRIFGGDTSKKSFSEWEESLNYENSKIIEYSNFIQINSLIEDFLDKDIKIKLDNALNLIDKKYEERKKYYEHIKEAKESIISDDIKGSGSQRNGICNEDNLIYSYKKQIRKKGQEIINEIFSDIIVGWRIISNINDGSNGDYSFKNPILNNSINFEFNSKKGKIFGKKAQSYDLIIFFMKSIE